MSLKAPVYGLVALPHHPQLPTIAETKEPVIAYFAALEETGFSIWLRESGFAFFTSLTLHSLAMACVVGINVAMGLRLLGIAGGIRLDRMAAFYPLHWYGALLVLVSGIALLIAYPAKALTNPVFYLKLAALGSGLLIARNLQLRLEALPTTEISPELRRLGAWSLALWLLTIFAGRFLAYTHTTLLASSFI